MLKKTLLLISLTLAHVINASAMQTPHEINPSVYSLALRAYHNAIKNHVTIDNPVLTIIDFSLPSTQKRLWTIDPSDQRVLLNTWVAQGKNTGLNFATRFSNNVGSHESSLGLYSTTNTFYGNDGYSLGLVGLDQGFNNNAKRRDIVIHGAWYISPSFIKTHHYLGRSWGCFALNKKILTSTIELIKNHSLVFAYYPNQNWLSHSRFLANTA